MSSLEYELKALTDSAKRKLHDAKHRLEREIEHFEHETNDIFKELSDKMESHAEREVEKKTK